LRQAFEDRFGRFNSDHRKELAAPRPLCADLLIAGREALFLPMKIRIIQHRPFV